MDSEGSGRSTKQSEIPKHQLPVAVEAVVRYGYPQDIVLSVYQKLSSESSLEVSQSANGEPVGASGGTPICNTIHAALLLTSVEAAIGNASSHPYGPPSLRITSKVSSGEGWADGDLESDGLGDGSRHSSRSERFPCPIIAPEQSTAAAKRTETSKPSTPSSSTSATTTASARVTPTVTSTSAQACALPEPALTKEATSASTNLVTSVDVSRPSDVSPVSSPAATGDFTFPQQASQPQRLTHVSPNASATQRATTPAEEKARERRRRLSRLQGLREENRRLKSRQTCRKCRQEPVNLTFLPCGHFLYCVSCGSNFDACPVCRKTILADVKTFLC